MAAGRHGFFMTDENGVTGMQDDDVYAGGDHHLRLISDIRSQSVPTVAAFDPQSPGQRSDDMRDPSPIQRAEMDRLSSQNGALQVENQQLHQTNQVLRQENQALRSELENARQLNALLGQVLQGCLGTAVTVVELNQACQNLIIQNFKVEEEKQELQKNFRNLHESLFNATSHMHAQVAKNHQLQKQIAQQQQSAAAASSQPMADRPKEPAPIQFTAMRK